MLSTPSDRVGSVFATVTSTDTGWLVIINSPLTGVTFEEYESRAVAMASLIKEKT